MEKIFNYLILNFFGAITQYVGYFIIVYISLLVFVHVIWPLLEAASNAIVSVIVSVFHLPARPGTIEKMVQDVMSVLAAGVLMIILCCIGADVVRHYRTDFALIQRSQTVSGCIVSVWENSADELGIFRAHGGVYEYRLSDGRKFSASTYLGYGYLADEPRYHQKADPVQIEYLPEKPNVSRLKGDGLNLIKWSLHVGFWTLALTGGFGFSLFFIYLGVVGFIRDWRNCQGWLNDMKAVDKESLLRGTEPPSRGPAALLRGVFASAQSPAEQLLRATPQPAALQTEEQASLPPGE